MSKKNKVEISCPQCSEKQSVIVWSSLNVTLDPKAQDDLFNRKINVFQCNECGSEIKVRAWLLYHDMRKQFCVQYIPIESVIEGNNLTSEFDEHGNLRSNGRRKKDDDNYNYMSDIHAVFDMEELLRYILFREELFKNYNKNELFKETEEQAPSHH